MKKLLFFAALCVAALVSCSKETAQDHPADVTPDAATPSILHASIQISPTKAGFDYVSSERTYIHFWESGDGMAFFPKNSSAHRYSCTDPENGTFTLSTVNHAPPSISDMDQYYAAYPYGNLIGLGAEFDEELQELLDLYFGVHQPVTEDHGTYTFHVEMPDRHTVDHDANTLGYGNIMFATEDNEGDVLHFKSCVGWLKLQLTGAAPVSHVTLATRGSVIAGHGMVTVDEDGIPRLTMDNDHTLDATKNYKRIFIRSPHLLLDPVDPTPFYFSLPPGVYDGGFTVTITYTDGTQSSFETTRDISIVRNQITPMKAREAACWDAELVQGTTFNNRLKTLANGGVNVAFTASESRIKGIAVRLGSEVETDCIVSGSASTIPVYAAFDSGTGVITLHSRAYRLFVNPYAVQMFYNMKGLASVDWDSFDCSRVAYANQMFHNCTALTSIGNVYMPVATTSHNLFNACSNLTHAGDIILPESENTSYMFNGCIKLTSVGNITIPVSVDVNSSFRGCSRLVSFGDFSAPEALDASNLFYFCSALQSVGDINLPKATAASCLFQNCSVLENIGSVTLTAAQDIHNAFYQCSRLGSVNGVKFPSATNASLLFYNCSALSSVGAVSLPVARNVSGMFSGCRSLTSIGDVIFPKATQVADLFNGCSSLTGTGTVSLPLAQVAKNLFNGCSSLTSFGELSLPEATDAANVFNGCSALEKVGNISLNIATDVSNLLSDCPSLVTVGDISAPSAINAERLIGSSSADSADWSGSLTRLGTITLSSVRNAHCLLRGCSSLEEVRIDTGNYLDDISYMFDNCSSLRKVENMALSSSSLRYAAHLFYNCPNLETVDISGLAGTVYSLAGMFYNCAKLTDIRFNSEFYTDDVYSYESIFKGCSALEQLYIKGFFLGKRSDDNPAVRFADTMTGVKPGCTVHYTAVPDEGPHANSFDLPSMFASYSSPSSSSFIFTTH